VIEGVRNLVTILVQGTLLPIGRLTLIDAALDRISAAALAPSGSILRRIITARTILTSALTVSGIASRLGQFKRPTMAGVLSFAGAVTNATTGGIWNYTTTGIASFAEALSKLYQALRTYAGALSLAGAVSRSKDMGRTITGALTFAGQSLGIFTDRDWNLGFLFPTGNVTPYLNTNRAVYASTLTTTGIVTVSLRVMARTLSGTLTPVSSELARYRDILYYGPPNP
jgi:hypothetical protein